MSDANPTDKDTYSIDFDVSSPGGILWVLGVLNQLQDNDGVFRVAVEVESTEPLSPDELFQQSVATASNQSVTTTEAVAEQTTTVEPSEQDEASDESEDEDEEELTCEHCGEPFESERALSGHLAQCDERPSDDDEEPRTIDDEYEISVGTRPYKVASVLAHTEEPLTAGDMEGLLADTEWAMDKGRFSTMLGDLYRDALVEREQRASSGPGKNPYQYWLNDDGRTLVEQAEEAARERGIDTYEDLAVSLDEDGDDSDDESEYECEECGEPFDTAQGLGSHRYHKHSDDGEDDTEDSSDESEATDGDASPLSDLTLNPDTRRYHVASTLTLTNEPVRPRDVEEMLAGTEWEHERSNISNILGDLFREGAADRDQREDEHGKPYEYILNEEGRKRVNEAILEADEAGEETLNDVFPERAGDDEDSPTGLDALFSEDEEAESGFDQHSDDETEVNDESADSEASVTATPEQD